MYEDRLENEACGVREDEIAGHEAEDKSRDDFRLVTQRHRGSRYEEPDQAGDKGGKKTEGIRDAFIEPEIKGACGNHLPEVGDHGKEVEPADDIQATKAQRAHQGIILL